MLDGLRAPLRSTCPAGCSTTRAAPRCSSRSARSRSTTPRAASSRSSRPNLPAIAAAIGPSARVIEPGERRRGSRRACCCARSSSLRGTCRSISATSSSTNTARALRTEFPGLEVQPVFEDYTGPLEAARADAALRRARWRSSPARRSATSRPDAARAFLARLRDLAGPGGMLLLGADSSTDREVARTRL